MMLSIAVLVAATLSLAHATVPTNSTCSDPWLFIDIHNRQTEGKKDFYQYGLFIGAGTPSQNMSLWPFLSYNDTRLASYHFCDGSSVPDCQNYTHARFESATSASWQDGLQSAALGASSLVTKATYGADLLNLFTHFFDPSPASKFTLHNHSIAYLSNYKSYVNPFFSSSALGLGPSSSVLDHLIAVGRVTRRVVGMYLGTSYPRAGGDRNGSIVLGGYDAGRIDGPAHEYQQAPVPAPGYSSLKLHIKQVSIVTADGSSIPLVTDDGFHGYLSTSQYAIEFPGSVTYALATAIGATPANNAEATLQASKIFDGSLTVTLGDGYQLTYPPEWVMNASNMTPIAAMPLNSSNTISKPLVLGAAFLHHLYLTIDYDSNTFSLANAKLYDSYVQPASLCPNTLPAPTLPPVISNFTKLGLAGAVLGGVVGLAGVSFMILWILRKRLQANAFQTQIDKMEKGVQGRRPVPMKSSLRKKPRTMFSRGTKKRKLANAVSFLTPQKTSFESSLTTSPKQ